MILLLLTTFLLSVDNRSLAGPPLSFLRQGGDFFVAAAAAAVDTKASPVTRALREGKYPWYDGETDQLRPVWPPRISWLEGLRRRFQSIIDWFERLFDRIKLGENARVPFLGNVVATVVLLAVLVAFFGCLLMLWARRESGPSGREARLAPVGAAARLGDLPEGLRPGDGDPWAEAQRRRAAGDYAGAIVCLFAHQLLVLDELGVIRLAPGKTGRHYVQGLRDHDLALALGATLRMFEDVYYGRKAPTRAAFESVWNRASLVHERRRTSRSGASQ